MRLTTLALCAVLTFSGCGGGSNNNDSGASPQASARRHASQTLTQAAAALATTTMAESAEQLMDEAQARYPALFPGPQQSQSLPPFAYRHFPSTGNYVGVALVSDGPYVAGNVYVLGASFGDKPVSVGPLTQFITPKVNRVTVILRTNSVVADIARSVFYASVPGSVVGQGNRIATINATSGQVQYSAPVGSEPNVMALAADGGSLYVALDGSGEVARLALPGLEKLGTVRLPSGLYGQTTAESLAASPTEAGTFAVSLLHPGLSSGHAGVLLVRDMVARPQRTPDSPGANLITFAPNGQLLYGLNIEDTEFGLRRIAVQLDGLKVETVVGAGTNFGTRSIDAAGSMVSAGATLWSAPALMSTGRVSQSNDCRFRKATLLLCVIDSYGYEPRGLLLVDPTTATITSALAMPAPQSILDNGTVVPGPGATVAWREFGRITLVRDEGLR
jgi:hypothetical protein